MASGELLNQEDLFLRQAHSAAGLLCESWLVTEWLMYLQAAYHSWPLDSLGMVALH